MSAVPAIRPQYRPSNRPDAQPVARRKPVSRPHLKVVERPRTNFGVIVYVRVLSFALLVGVTYLASSLGGQVMVEKARREAVGATERARASQAAIAPLKAQAQKAQDGLEIQKWAAANDFQAPEWASAPSSEVKNLVASKAND